MTSLESRTKPICWVVAAAVAAVFLLDVLTPVGIAVPMLYVLPILLTGIIPGWRSTVFLTVIIVSLTWVELVLVPGKVMPLIFGNRVTASFLLLVVAGLVLKQKHLAQQRTRDQAALRESEERYALVVAGAEAAVWDWDVPEKRVLFSPRWKALRGLTNDEVSDHETEWSSRIHSDDKERVTAAVRAHFEGKTTVFSEEYRIRHKDGRWIWISDHGLAKRDHGGNVVRMAGSETDITGRKEAETALRESEERLLLALESANMGTWDWDAETDSLRCNHWQAAFFGARPGDFPGTGTEALSKIHADDRARVCTTIRKVLEEGVTVREEFRIVHADGSVRWLFGSGRPVQDEHGRGRHVVGVSLDITERRLEQDRVKSLNEILEQRVRERTAQLVEANERWDWVVRATNDGVWDWDLVRDTA